MAYVSFLGFEDIYDVYAMFARHIGKISRKYYTRVPIIIADTGSFQNHLPVSAIMCILKILTKYDILLLYNNNGEYYHGQNTCSLFFRKRCNRKGG